MFTKHLASAAVVTAVLAGGLSAAGNRAEAATLRTFPTAGLQTYTLGGGVKVYTNTPGAISSFSWNTGTSSGTATNIGSAITIGP